MISAKGTSQFCVRSLMGFKSSANLWSSMVESWLWLWLVMFKIFYLSWNKAQGCWPSLQSIVYIVVFLFWNKWNERLTKIQIWWKSSDEWEAELIWVEQYLWKPSAIYSTSNHRKHKIMVDIKLDKWFALVREVVKEDRCRKANTMFEQKNSRHNFVLQLNWCWYHCAMHVHELK